MEEVEEIERDEEVELEFNKFVIPPNTRFDERVIVTENDIIVGAGCKIGYGLIGRKIIVGERTTIGGNITGEEVRLDSWTTVNGDVVSKRDAFIGEFTTINGRLTVFGDLEIGRNVRIKNGFEAKGLITIQDPLPVLMFLFLYILELLRLGRLEEVEKLIPTEEFKNPLIIPDNSKVDLEFVETNKDLIAVGSKILGNVKCKSFKSEGCEVFGSIRTGDVVLDASRVHGAIEGKEIYLVNGTEVFGSMNGERIQMEESCKVEASIIGKKGVWIKSSVEIPEKLSIPSDVKSEELMEEIDILSENLEESEKQEKTDKNLEEKDVNAKVREKSNKSESEDKENSG